MSAIVRLGTLFACCLWGATAGWAVALAMARPEPMPGPTLLAYGAMALLFAGYLLGARCAGASRLALRAAALTAATSLAAKALAPGLAAWVAVLIAAAVFGFLCGLARTRTRPRDGASAVGAPA